MSAAVKGIRELAKDIRDGFSWVHALSGVAPRSVMPLVLLVAAEVTEIEQGEAKSEDDVEQAWFSEAAVHLRAAARCFEKIEQRAEEKKTPLDTCQGAEGERAGGSAKKPYTPPTLRQLGSARNIGDFEAAHRELVKKRTGA